MTETPTPKTRWRKWRGNLAFVAALVLIVQAVNWWQTRHVVQGSAPQFTAPLAIAVNNSSTFNFQQWHSQYPNRITVVYFWAEWCGICKLQQGAIQAIMRDYPVVTVAMQSGDANQVRRYLEQHQLPWLAAVDKTGAISRLYGIHSVPSILIINAQGNIHSATSGYSPSWALRWRLWRAQFGY